MHIARNVNAIFGNTYLLWHVKTDITWLQAPLKPRLRGCLDVESGAGTPRNSVDTHLEVSAPMRDVPRRVKARCTPGLGNISCSPYFSPIFIHPPSPTIHIWWESRSGSRCLFSLSSYLVSANSDPFSFPLVLRRKRYREEIKSFFSIKKTVLLVVRPRNCETFTLAELIKSPSIGALY